jgi:high-affinity Fe2+/Pb2+ permease
MRLTWRDGITTTFVGAAVAIYLLWTTQTAFVDLSTTVIGLVVFGLGWGGLHHQPARSRRGLWSRWGEGA